MKLREALADIERLGRDGGADHRFTHEETSCHDTQAVHILAEAYDHLRRRDPLYGDRRRFRCMVPPPGSVPPG